MPRRASRLGLTAGLAFGFVWIALSGVSSGLLQYQKEARDAGVDVRNCQHCHVEKLPRKESHEPNAVGRWLIARKARRGAASVNGAWLKDYPGSRKIRKGSTD